MCHVGWLLTAVRQWFLQGFQLSTVVFAPGKQPYLCPFETGADPAASCCRAFVVLALQPYVVSAAVGPRQKRCRICGLDCCCSWRLLSCCACLAAAGNMLWSIHTSGVVLQASLAGCVRRPTNALSVWLQFGQDNWVDASIWLVLSGCGWVAVHKPLGPSLLQVALVLGWCGGNVVSKLKDCTNGQHGLQGICHHQSYQQTSVMQPHDLGCGAKSNSLLQCQCTQGAGNYTTCTVKLCHQACLLDSR
jgi:hypothetical protein